MDQSNNELLNYGLPVLYCEIHKSNFIIKGCMDSNCKKRILLCVQCLNDHNNHTELLLGIFPPHTFLDLPQFLDSFITSLKLKTSL